MNMVSRFPGGPRPAGNGKARFDASSPFAMFQLQFRLMAPEAQHTAIQRLALRGWDASAISTQTGMPEADVQRYLAGTSITRPSSINAQTSRGESSVVLKTDRLVSNALQEV